MGQSINEISSALAIDLGKTAATGAAAAAGALAAQAGIQVATRKFKRKKFKDTVTGQELLRRLQSAKDSLNDLKTERDDITPVEFRDRAKKLEKRIAKLKKQIQEKQREFNS